MANRYVRQGETYNGDGTASNAAASAGAAGAYNSVLDCLKQTAGYTVSADDVVYIKTTNAATESFAVTLSASASWGHADGAIWFFDDGTIWSGAAGIITINVLDAAYTTFVINNIFFGNHRVQHVLDSGWYEAANICVSQNAILDAFDFDWSALTSTAYSYMPQISGIANSVRMTFTNCYFKFGSYDLTGLFACPGEAVMTFFNPRIELTRSVPYPVFSFITSANGGTIRIYGGEVFGDGAGSLTPLFKMYYRCGDILVSGLKYPRQMPFYNSEYISAAFAIAHGGDGMMGSQIASYYFDISSRDDGNFPVLNAVLPDSAATPWSYKLYLKRVSLITPGILSIGKLWTQATAIKTVTLNFLSHDNMETPTTKNCWIIVEYTDTDGRSQSVSTFDYFGETTISTSTAGWSADYYGAEIFTKRQIQATTPTAVAQDTVINITFLTTLLSGGVNEVLFVCPDPVLS